ncbi:MAG: hypothetical protein ACLP56_07890 [Candidatus Sulfotelmatobacter sp.]
MEIAATIWEKTGDGGWDTIEQVKRAVGTALISPGPALVANSLCRGQGKRTLRKPEVKIGNRGPHGH